MRMDGGTEFQLCLHFLANMPVADVDEVAGYGGCGGHFGRDQMRATAAALAAFEVTIARRGAALAGLKNVGIHAQAHGAAGLAPVESCLDEDLVETLGFGLRLDGLRAGNDH